MDMLINGSTQLFAVIGNPITHSLSPIMHNAAYKALNLNAIYVPCHVSGDYLSNTAVAIKALNFQGVNVTIPFKQTITPYLNGLEGDSIYTHSVNTIINKNGLLYGTSTDGIGFIRSLHDEGNFELSNKKVILIGAGGAAYALAYRLVKSGISRLCCFNRQLMNAENLQKKILVHTNFMIDIFPLSELKKTETENFDLIINTTSVGLSDDLTLISKGQLHQRLFIYDVVYKRGGTRLIREAKEAGCRYLDGLSLLVYQGAESFRLWFNREPPIQIMWTSLINYLESASN